MRLVTVLVIAGIFSGCGEDKPFYDVVPALREPRKAAWPAPLGPAAIRVQWEKGEIARELQAGSTVIATASFTNAGNVTWPDLKTTERLGLGGRLAVRLGCSWLDLRAPSAPRTLTGERADLPQPLRPGETATLQLRVHVPETPGDYHFAFDLVQENTFWFSDRGAETLPVKVRVVSR